MKDEIQRILSDDKVVRVTMSRIGKNLNIQSLLEHNISEMPRTKQLINQSTESIKDFQIRRVTMVVNNLVLQNKPIKAWMIYRKARLKQNCSEEIKSIISEFVSYLK